MTDPDIEGLHRPGSSKGGTSVHDCRLRQGKHGVSCSAPRSVEIPELPLAASGLLADAHVRERLEAILAYRAAGRDAANPRITIDMGLDRDEEISLTHAQSKPYRQDFAEALGPVVGDPFSLDDISRPPTRRTCGLCTPEDVHTGFDIDSATWFRDAHGKPAVVVTWPGYLNPACLAWAGCVARAASARGIDILSLPCQLSWGPLPICARSCCGSGPLI